MHASSVCPELPLLRFQIMKVTIAPTVILLEVGVGGCQPTRGMLDCLLVGLGLRSLLGAQHCGYAVRSSGNALPSAMPGQGGVAVVLGTAGFSCCSTGRQRSKLERCTTG